MKVLFWMFSGFDVHTTSEHLLNAILEQLCNSGHRIHILQKGSGGSLPAVPENLDKGKITTTVIPFKRADKKNFVTRYLNELKYVSECKKHICGDYDAVFIQSNTVAGFAVRLVKNQIKKARITLNVQDIFPYNAAFAGSIKKNGLIFKTFEIEQKYAYRKADHIITISDDMKKMLIEDGVNGSKIHVIYNWSYQDEPYNITRQDFSLVSDIYSKDYFNVVYAGNVGVMQNVDLIIDTAILMRNNKAIWFHVIGNGVYKDKLVQKAKENGVTNISFWPMQPVKLAPYIYSFADLNVIPLMKDVYKTALPSKTATCLLCEKPIVFAIGKDSEFGKKISEYHYVIESDDPEQLKSIISDLAEGKATEKKRVVYSEFSKTRNSKLYADIICGMEGVLL